MPTPADIASSGMMLVLYVAAGNFFIKLGLRIFQKQEFSWIVDIFAITFLAGALYFSMKGFMDITKQVNSGVWK